MAKLGGRNRGQKIAFTGLQTSYFKRKASLLRHLKKSEIKLTDEIVSDVASESTDNATLESISSQNIPQLWQKFRLSPSKPKAGELFNKLRRSNTKLSQIASMNNSEPQEELKIPGISDVEEAGLKEYYDLIINSAAWQQANMNLKPGDQFYLFWFFCSAFIPLVASCTGPLSNIFSLLAIICPWKVHKFENKDVKDPAWCYAVNSISIVFAIISNFCLILNYRRKIRYTYAQIVSVCGWGIASYILVSLIIVYHYWFYHEGLDEHYTIGEGFWFACVSVVLHFTSHILLMLNELGFLLKKYKPLFNIDKVQETLIIQTVSLSVWLMIGAAIFTRVLKLRLSDSMLYCVTSVTTIGLQDDVSNSNALGQTLTSIWIICGLVMFGLIITSIGKMLFQFSRTTLACHRMEVLRRIVYRAHEFDQSSELSNADSFNLIKKVSKGAFQVQGIIEVTFAIIIFMITLMCGGMALALVEGWSYKFGVYFCFFNLMTLGLSNTPNTPGGKAFFCAWAIAAIPVMTILVSTTSDFVFSKLTQMEQLTFFEIFVEFCLSKKYLRNIGKFLKKKENVYVDMPTLKTMRTRSMFVVDESNNESSGINEEEETYVDKSEEEKIKGGYTLNPNDPICKVPVLCHPADMLYKLIIDGDSHHSYGFVNQQIYVDSAITTIHLANYFREGMHVSIPNDELYVQRLKLGQSLKALDPNFDVDLYIEMFNLYPTDHDSVGVIQDGNCIRTKFKKKHNFVLNQLSRMQLLLIELRKSIMDMCTDPNKKYTYEEWQTLFNLTNRSSSLNDNIFWIRAISPLAVPMQEPKYFTLHYLRHFQEMLEMFALAWDDYDASKSSKPAIIS
ncbi:hypothetical protein CANINC_002495 [Pichia inconspicua]|uniref:Potassium channel domain-containing protein n=1 Tax=Pichia inconspicua TaxID=52247 RepID=A0A4V4NFP2_9ASCO|nr:hypothetical protein CANINC_002495 [[Candida] inconspicua]